MPCRRRVLHSFTAAQISWQGLSHVCCMLQALGRPRSCMQRSSCSRLPAQAIWPDSKEPQPGFCLVQTRLQPAAVGMAARARPPVVTGAGMEAVTAPAAAGACR